MQCVILGQTLVQEGKKNYKNIIGAMECEVNTTSMLSFPILIIILWLYKRMFLF